MSDEVDRLRTIIDDMARVLLAVEWTMQLDGWVICPSCHAQRGFDSARAVTHTPDCALDAALRKAGVRPQ